MMHYCFFFWVVYFVFVSCGSREGGFSQLRTDEEIAAQLLLSQSREALSKHRFEEARTYILRLRQECRHALNGREEGILLLDSILWLQARHEMVLNTDSLKQASLMGDEREQQRLMRLGQEMKRKERFYYRKLQHDQQQRHYHD